MGCSECGLVYSLVFGIQYHKVDCTVGLGDDRSLRERRRDAEQVVAVPGGTGTRPVITDRPVASSWSNIFVSR